MKVKINRFKFCCPMLLFMPVVCVYKQEYYNYINICYSNILGVSVLAHSIYSRFKYTHISKLSNIIIARSAIHTYGINYKTRVHYNVIVYIRIYVHTYISRYKNIDMIILNHLRWDQQEQNRERNMYIFCKYLLNIFW